MSLRYQVVTDQDDHFLHGYKPNCGEYYCNYLELDEQSTPEYQSGHDRQRSDVPSRSGFHHPNVLSIVPMYKLPCDQVSSTCKSIYISMLSMYICISLYIYI